MKNETKLTSVTAMRQRARDNIQARAWPAGCRAAPAIVRTQLNAQLAACSRSDR